MATIKEFTNTKQPVVLIFGIKNPVAQGTIKIFLEENSRVLVIDTLNTATKTLIKPFNNNSNFMFANVNSLSKYLDSFMRLDYVYIFLHNIILGSDYPNLYKTKFNYVSLTHKDFIFLSNTTDALIKQAIEYASKLTITMPLDVGPLIAKQSQYNLKLYTYTRDLFFDLYNRAPFNGRLAYLPLDLGILFDYSIASLPNFILRQVVSNKTINVPGDGLIKVKIAHTQDITKALLLASFSPRAVGKEVIFENTPITLLNLLYNALELTQNERKIKFDSLTPEITENIKQASKYKPLETISTVDLGYNNQYSIEKSIHEALQTTNSILNANWKPVEKTPDKVEKITVTTTPRTKEILPNFGEKYKSFDSPLEKAFWYALWMLFNFIVRKPVDFVYSLLAEQDSQARKKLITMFLTILFAYLLSLGIAPYLMLLNSLNKLKTTSQIPIIQHELKNIEDNIYNISYLKHVGLQDQLTYLEQIIKTYQETINKINTAQIAYTNFETFVQNLIQQTNASDNKTTLREIKANPYFINNIVDQLRIYNGQLNKLTPKFNTILEASLLKEKPILQDQINIQLKQLQTIQNIYPYLPDLAGYQNQITYDILVVDTTKPNYMGGYPIGILQLNVKDGIITYIKYHSLNKSYRDALAKATTSKEIYNILRPVISKQQKINIKNLVIATLSTNAFKDITSIVNNIYIPEYGLVNPTQIPDIFNKFATFNKLPYTEEELINTILNKLRQQEPPILIQAFKTLLETKNKNISIIKAPVHLTEIFNSLNVMHTSTTAKQDVITIDIYDKLPVLDMSYTKISKQIDIIIDNNKHKITINTTYSSSYPQGLTSVIKLNVSNGSLQTLSASQGAKINMPFIEIPLTLKPNTETMTFVQFTYNTNKIKYLKIYNINQGPKLYLHITNPTSQQKELIYKLNPNPQVKDNTYIVEVKGEMVKVGL